QYCAGTAARAILIAEPNLWFVTDGGAACSVTVTTDAATDITSSSATLNGTVSISNTSADVTFDYGLTTSYGASVIAAESPVTGTSNTSVSYTLAGLSPNTTYLIRVVGQSIAGTTDGDDKTFSALCVSAVTVQNDNDSGP